MLQHPVQLMPMGIDTHSRHHLCKFSSAMPHSSGVCEEDCKIGVEKVPRCKDDDVCVFFLLFYHTKHVESSSFDFQLGCGKGKKGRQRREEEESRGVGRSRMFADIRAAKELRSRLDAVCLSMSLQRSKIDAF